jgi:GH24 family phage-related lysozyme (muramidase)
MRIRRTFFPLCICLKLTTCFKTFQDCITNDTGDNVILNANQYGALVSWASNVTCENSGFSTLIKRLNDGEDPTSVATDELPRWKMAGGEVVPAFERRRAAELDLFLTPSDEDALPALC